MIAIIDYGSGNIQAISNIYRQLSIEHFVAKKPSDLDCSTKIILPGVGSFDQTMSDLNQSGMRESLERHVNVLKKNVLGICVGMQILSKNSEEGVLDGLGWINGTVKKFNHQVDGKKYQLPHMGWNNVKSSKNNFLLQGVEDELGFYFLHSYYFYCMDENDILAETEYGIEFTSSVHHDNIFGTQFHPEKSHSNGVQLLKNFAEL